MPESDNIYKQDSKSDFIKDEKQLAEYAKELNDAFNKIPEFTMAGRPCVETKTDANGLSVLNITNKSVDMADLLKYPELSDWKYGTYLLGAYPMTGFYKMVDGKYVFLRAENIIDKSRVVEYKDINDIIGAITEANIGANGLDIASSISITSDSTIQIPSSCLVDGILRLPTTDLQLVHDAESNKYVIVSSMDPTGKKFEVEILQNDDVKGRGRDGDAISEYERTRPYKDSDMPNTIEGEESNDTKTFDTSKDASDILNTPLGMAMARACGEVTLVTQASYQKMDKTIQEQILPHCHSSADIWNWYENNCVKGNGNNYLATKAVLLSMVYYLDAVHKDMNIDVAKFEMVLNQKINENSQNLRREVFNNISNNEMEDDDVMQMQPPRYNPNNN